MGEIHTEQLSGDDANSQEEERQCDEWYSGDENECQVVQKEAAESKREKNRYGSG